MVKAVERRACGAREVVAALFVKREVLKKRNLDEIAGKEGVRNEFVVSG